MSHIPLIDRIRQDGFLENLKQEINMPGQHEHPVKNYMLRLYYRYIFSGDEYNIKTEFSPRRSRGSGDRFRVDIGVEFQFRSGLFQVIVAEVKKAGADDGDIVDVEQAALEACVMMSRDTSQDKIFVMTCYGTKLRLWLHDQKKAWQEEEGLISLYALWGNNRLADRNQYIDLYEDEDGVIERAFEHIIKRGQFDLVQTYPGLY